MGVSDVPTTVELRFAAMGTQLTVTVCCPQSRAQLAAEAIRDLQTVVERFGKDFWAWGNGRLAAINRILAAGEVANIPADMRLLFLRAWQSREATGGLFEPRIGMLVRLWGFADVEFLGTAPPDPAAVSELLAALRAAPAYDGGATYGPASGVAWDFGGIGKGYIVDETLTLLAQRGFPHALVDAGGNLATRGARAARPWRIGIRDPRSGSSAPALLATLETGDEAVMTHGDDQRYFEYLGKRYTHVLDPAEGIPATGLRSLTVVHRDATRADAEGAALYTAGPRGWRSLAERLGQRDVMVVDGTGRVIATESLARRLEPQPGVEIAVVG